MGVQILIGDSLEQLKRLPDNSVHMVLTSPPYFGLRDYGTGEWAGGDAACGHVVGEMRRGVNLAASAASTRGGGKKIAEAPDIQAREQCPHCGARRVDRQIGLEATPAAFIGALVEVFEEARRVLRDDGTLWVNMGDSYCSRPSGSIGKEGRLDGSYAAHTEYRRAHSLRKPGVPQGYRHKSLMGIPWRLAFALQDAGWVLRRDIIWAKLNPMPESVEDRPTTAHEYLFMFAKSATTLLWKSLDTNEFTWTRPNMSEPLRDAAGEILYGVTGKPRRRWWGLDYYYDAAAIREPSSPESHARAARGRSDTHKNADGGPGNQTIAKRSPSAGRMPGVTPKSADLDRSSGVKANATYHASMSQEMRPMRNKRSVWSTASEAFGEAHFATYPPALIEPAILAGCPPGGVVLDPFGGAGTTGLVAERLGRSAILIELNPDFAAMADRRLRAARCQMDTPALAPPAAGPLFEERPEPDTPLEIPGFLRRMAT